MTRALSHHRLSCSLWGHGGEVLQGKTYHSTASEVLQGKTYIGKSSDIDILMLFAFLFMHLEV